MESIYRTPEGRAEVLAWYGRALPQLPLAVDSRRVDTRFGRTHLLLAGPEQGRPLVVVHEVMRHVRSAATPGRPFDAANLAGLEAPVLLVTGGRDLVFPGARSERRAREILPTRHDAVHLENAGHVHPEVVGPRAVERIARFLGGGADA